MEKVAKCQKKLAKKCRKWEDLVQQRLHAEAGLALADPDSAERKRLVEQTRRHPRFAEKYGQALKDCQKVVDHEACIADVRDVLDAQERVQLVLALDCEMVETVSDNMALARVSVVDLKGKTVLDLLVLPCHPNYIEDCRTSVTGLTKPDLEAHGVSVEEARKRFAMLCCRDTVLIGHALDHDLLALKFQHDLVIDTCMLYPVLGPGKNEPLFEQLHSLGFLTEIVLKRGMDREKRAGIHDSVEDACNSLDLVKYCVCARKMAAHDDTFLVCPPLPPKQRNYRTRGPAHGASGALQGRRDYANAGFARSFAALGKDEESRQATAEFYSLYMDSSVTLYHDGESFSILQQVREAHIAKKKEKEEQKKIAATVSSSSTTIGTSSSSSSSSKTAMTAVSSSNFDNRGKAFHAQLYRDHKTFLEQQKQRDAASKRMDKLKRQVFKGRGGPPAKRGRFQLFK